VTETTRRRRMPRSSARSFPPGRAEDTTPARYVTGRRGVERDAAEGSRREAERTPVRRTRPVEPFVPPTGAAYAPRSA